MTQVLLTFFLMLTWRFIANFINPTNWIKKQAEVREEFWKDVSTETKFNMVLGQLVFCMAVSCLIVWVN